MKKEEGNIPKIHYFINNLTNFVANHIYLYTMKKIFYITNIILFMLFPMMTPAQNKMKWLSFVLKEINRI